MITLSTLPEELLNDKYADKDNKSIVLIYLNKHIHRTEKNT